MPNLDDVVQTFDTPLSQEDAERKQVEQKKYFHDDVKGAWLTIVGHEQKETKNQNKYLRIEFVCIDDNENSGHHVCESFFDSVNSEGRNFGQYFFHRLLEACGIRVTGKDLIPNGFDLDSMLSKTLVADVVKQPNNPRYMCVRDARPKPKSKPEAFA